MRASRVVTDKKDAGVAGGLLELASEFASLDEEGEAGGLTELDG